MFIDRDTMRFRAVRRDGLDEYQPKLSSVPPNGAVGWMVIQCYRHLTT